MLQKYKLIHKIVRFLPKIINIDNQSKFIKHETLSEYPEP